MFIMQDNDTRLFKAAKRTIRAEATLVIVIILLASWSIYGLYKLSLNGSDSILSWTWSGSSVQDSSNSSKKLGKEINSNANDTSESSINSRSYRILQELLDNQRDFHRGPQKLELSLDDIRNLKSPYEIESFLDHHRRQRSNISSWPSLRQYDQDKRFRSEISAPQLMNLKTLAAISQGQQFSPQAEHSDDSMGPDLVNYSRDEDYDRQVAESNKEPSESVISSTDIDIYSPTQDNDETKKPEDHRTNSEEYSPDDLEPETNDGLNNPVEMSDNSEESSDQKSNEKSEPTEDEEPPSETSQDIDEEVDRMTQPSLGSVSQQDRPTNYANMVQFDDSLSPSDGSLGPTISISRRLSAGDQEARFVGARKRAPEMNQSESDLQIDQDEKSPVLKNTRSVAATRNVSDNSKKIPLVRKQLNSTIKGDIKGKQRRQKRSKDSESKLIPPYEIYNSIHKYDIDLISLPTLADSRRSTLELVDDNSTIDSSNMTDYKTQANYDPDRRLFVARKEVELPTIDGRSDSPDYRYLTTNDNDLRNLLTQKYLLDALQTSQLPPPQGTPKTPDHQTAGSLFSVDHGLLLYPSKKTRSFDKSSASKKKKDEKGKKKVTVAFKKGGHKKKKHKKEEKKYLKEKKFKGSKKGKKVSKGKGGQGGKKGKKFYKDKGFKKKGFKNVYHKEEFGQKKSYFDEFRDKDFKKKWKKFDDKYNYAQMKKWQAKNVKGAKKVKDHGEKMKKYDKSKWKKKYEKKHQSASSKKKKSDKW